MPTQEAALLAEGRKPTVRFRVPENQDITFQDAVRGTVSFDCIQVVMTTTIASNGMPIPKATG